MRTSVALASLLCASVTCADVITVPLDLCGGYNSAGGFSNSPAFQNYRVGLSPITTTPERRNFFTFDLGGYAPLPPGSVTAASVKVYMPKFAPPLLLDPGDGYISPDESELFRLTATPYSAAALASPSHTAPEAAAIWATLGTGPLAGEVLLTPMDKGTIISIPLVPAAVGAINGLLGTGKVSFGGRIVTFAGTHVDELLFGFTDMPTPHMVGKEPVLELTIIPAPGAAGLLALGLFARRRR